MAFLNSVENGVAEIIIVYKEEWLYAWLWTGTSVEEVETADADKIDNAHPTEI
jgi:hypothetical protein